MGSAARSFKAMSYLRPLQGLGICLALAVVLLPAAAQCPPGFTHVGKLQGSTKETEVKIYPSIRLPDGLVLDTSYQQPSPSGKGGQAGSILSTQQIPPGIYIIPGGMASYGWAVSDPKMLDDRTFQMYLYCSQDSGALNLHWGCSVYVDVCAKPKNWHEEEGVSIPPVSLPQPPPPSNPIKVYVIKVYVENNSAFLNSFEFYDNVCKRAVRTIALRPHDKTFIIICGSGATTTGYGSFKARQVGNSIWNNFDLVSDGESRSLN
jgi:hypothetical protein